ncbi:MAG: Grx4 family monothiol glutaredoxin [Silvanigrellaceae bacterium]|nr:Grx4 family monothiol glutaredoxin [Silvanigrellaceae bacterium]
MSEMWVNKIQKDVSENDIMIYMRGLPSAPRCGFSARVIKVFNELGHPYKTEDMDSDPELWATLKEMNNWPTSPQIFIKGEFVGGCDIVVEMSRNGDLQKLINVNSEM